MGFFDREKFHGAIDAARDSGHEKSNEISQGVRGKVEAFSGGVKDRISQMREAVKQKWEQTKALGHQIAESTTAAKDIALGLMTNKGVRQEIGEVAGEGLHNMAEYGKGKVEEARNAASEWFSSEIITPIIEKKNELTANIKDLAERGKQTVVRLVDQGKQKFNETVTAAHDKVWLPTQAAAKKVGEGAVSLAVGAVGLGVEAGKAISRGAVSAYETGKEAVEYGKEKFNEGKEWAGERVEEAKEWGRNLLELARTQKDKLVAEVLADWNNLQASAWELAAAPADALDGAGNKLVTLIDGFRAKHEAKAKERHARAFEYQNAAQILRAKASGVASSEAAVDTEN